MAVFNESVYQNLSNVTQIFDVASEFTNGLIGLGIWLVITFGTLFLFGKTTKEGLIAAGFISIVSAILLAYIGLLQGAFVMIAFVLFTVGLLVMIIFKSVSV